MMFAHNDHNRINSIDHINTITDSTREVVFKNGAVYKGQFVGD